MIIRLYEPGEVPTALLSNVDPAPLSGVTDPGTSTFAARADHNHNDTELRNFVNAQKPAVDAAKDAALTAIATDKATAQTAINADKLAAQTAIATDEASAQTAISTDRSSALSAISTARTGAETSISNGIAEIETDRLSAIADIGSNKTTALSEISTAQTTAETSVTNLGNTKVAEIEAAAETAFLDFSESIFNSGAHFTPDTTTSLTLPYDYLNKANILVHFDGTYQSPSTYTLTGTTLTFNAVIPVGVASVIVKGGQAIQVANSTVSDGVVTPAKLSTGAMIWNASGDVTALGNIQFTKVGARILGDFSNAAVASRLMFQSSTVNGLTNVRAIPNGTGTDASLQVGNSSDPDNQSVLSMSVNAAATAISSIINGTGEYLPMGFYTSGIERIAIAINGEVNINGGIHNTQGIEVNATGTGNRTALIDLHGDDTYTDYSARFIRNNSGPNSTTAIEHRGTGSLSLTAVDAGAIAFRTSNTERMQITSTGFVGIGMGAGASRVRIFQNDASSYTNSHLELVSNSGNVHLGFHAAGATAVSLRHVRATDALDLVNYNQSAFSTLRAAAFQVNSDYRIKENVSSLVGALERIQNLKVKRFSFIKNSMSYSGGRMVDGFLAHEVAEVVPEAVMGEKDAVFENGEINAQGIDQSKLVPLLTAAVQELLEITKQQNARILALEGKV